MGGNSGMSELMVRGTGTDWPASVAAWVGRASDRPGAGLSPASPRPLGALAWARAAWDNSAAIWWRGAFVEPIQVWPGPARKILVPTAAPWVRQVLTSRAGSYEKGATARRAIAPLIGDDLFIAEGEEWRRQRHLFVPLLTHRSRLPDQVRRMVPAIDEGLDRWLAAPGGVLALEREATRLGGCHGPHPVRLRPGPPRRPHQRRLH